MLTSTLTRLRPKTPSLTPEKEGHQALALFGVDPEDHVLLHENVSQYLFNLDSEVPWDEFKNAEQATTWFDDLSIKLRESEKYEQMRWPKKLARELNRPYRDSEMPAYIKQIQADCRQSVEKFQAHYPQESLKFFVTGSPVYGRFGGNSDIDTVTLQVDDKARTIARECETGEISIGTFPTKTYQVLPCSSDAVQLPQCEPWEAIDELIVDNWLKKGIAADEDGGNIRRVASPPRTKDRAWLETPESCKYPNSPIQDRDGE